MTPGDPLPAADRDAVAERVMALAQRFSIEVTPRELDRLPPLRTLVPPGTAVYVTFLAGTGYEGTVVTAKHLAAEGMRPVPHLAARATASAGQLDGVLRSLVDSGVDDVLVVAGSFVDVAGPYPATIDLLRSGLLERHGIRRVGVAGHPEGSPDVPPGQLDQAIADKQAWAVAAGAELRLVTQFLFAGGPAVTWERAVRAAGHRLPVHLGLPGVASAATLLRFGLQCGVGPSLAVLRKQAGHLRHLASVRPQYPDATMVAVARALSADPGSTFAACHFFPFGGFERTAAWVRTLAAGRFVLTPDGSGIVTA